MMKVLTVIMLLALCHCAQSYMPVHRIIRSSSIFMGGGRSPAETASKASKKRMFKDLRNKLNEAAEIPGFFEVGDGPPVSNDHQHLAHCSTCLILPA